MKLRTDLRIAVAYTAICTAMALFISTYAIGADKPAPGQKLFEAKCAQCHGKDAKGNPKMEKLLKLDPSTLNLTKADAVSMTSDAIVAQITNGKKKMPGYKGKLTADQIQDIAAYLKGIQGEKAEQ